MMTMSVLENSRQKTLTHSGYKIAGAETLIFTARLLRIKSRSASAQTVLRLIWVNEQANA